MCSLNTETVRNTSVHKANHSSFQARELVLQSDGIEQTRALAHEYSDKAIAAIEHFPDSEAKDGLIDMAHKALQRQK